MSRWLDLGAEVGVGWGGCAGSGGWLFPPGRNGASTLCGWLGCVGWAV